MSPRRWTTPGAPGLLALGGRIARPVLSRPSGRWWLAFAGAGALTALMVAGIAWTFTQGVGAWGNNTSVVWGFGIANYVWWIGIGNAGTLISSMLLLTRQRWRASINRFAESMTLFAAAIAGIFPIIHMGRPMYWYWLAPYPNTMSLWPQWRSPLVWDFWAIASYILFSLIFWYVGLLPDLAVLRDRAKGLRTRQVYGALALGWRGSARQWRLHGKLHRTLAMLAVPLVCSVHSIVGLDFAASLMPGWAESIFPPYFVVGAMFSGFCIVIVLAAIIRGALGLQSVITTAHFDVMTKIVLAASIVMGAAYASEWFAAWYGGDAAEARFLRFVFTGPYQPLYVAMLALNVAVPQLLWLPRLRRDIGSVVIIALLVNVGMWLERILIILETLSHDYLPSSWRLFRPSLTDGAILAGSLGFFALLFLILARIAPLVSIHETGELAAAEARA
ncbi:MAG TPA: NrfD/PsrC family molybdoenzyme membrane anchor subunit [Caulobacteraceae bacterium]|jgi:molybdopterin-containing oxidoreductase family membrane subunit|nr:NrfD/PsrC family molybdoenzyme membrane anchor subunit [Caulobacteraceae bacterium]